MPWRATVDQSMSNTGLARQWAERYDLLAGAETADRVRANVALALVRFGQRRFGESWKLKTEALALARRLHESEAFYKAALGVLLTPGAIPVAKWPWALNLANEFVAAPREGVSSRGLAMVFQRAGNFSLAAGDRERAVGLWQRTVRLASNSREAALQLQPISFQEMQLFLDGQLGTGAVEAAAHLIAEADGSSSPVTGRNLRPI